jgi:hypothetical protein
VIKTTYREGAKSAKGTNTQFATKLIRRGEHSARGLASMSNSEPQMRSLNEETGPAFP